MAVFGAMALLLGLVGVLWPKGVLGMMRFELLDASARVEGDYTLTFLTASSMASVNMGAYYLLAARANWRDFYRWTVPFRSLTVSVFTLVVLFGPAPLGFLGVAVWELLGVLATALALRHDGDSIAASPRTRARSTVSMGL